MRFLLLQHKNSDKQPEAYGSIDILISHYPHLSKNTLADWLSRDKVPFENDQVIIQRVTNAKEIKLVEVNVRSLAWYGAIYPDRLLLEVVKDRAKKPKYSLKKATKKPK